MRETRAGHHDYVEGDGRMTGRYIRHRGASQRPLNQQRTFHLRRCRFYVFLFSRRRSLQQQLGRKVPMRSCLAKRLHLSDEARGVPLQALRTSASP